MTAHQIYQLQLVVAGLICLGACYGVIVREIGRQIFEQLKAGQTSPEPNLLRMLMVLREKQSFLFSALFTAYFCFFLAAGIGLL